MRLQSRRAQAEQAAAMSRLRDRISDLEAEFLEQGRANGRLAGRTASAEDALRNGVAAMGTANAGLHEENARLRQQVDRQRTTIRGLTPSSTTPLATRRRRSPCSTRGRSERN